MEEKLLSGLKTIGYDEITEDFFRTAVEKAPKSLDYSKIVHFLTNELRSLCSIDEEVNVIVAEDDYILFLMEISSFLKELGCPYQALSQGPISERLNSSDDKLLLLDYLLSELMSSRILQESKPDKQIELKLRETPEARNLKTILMTLRCGKPPENVTLADVFEKLNLRAETVVLERGKDLINEPIWNYKLDEQQWDSLSIIEKDLHDEYTIRRKMMLQRLDCTIQSFQWSEKMKEKGDLIMKTYSAKRKQLKVDPDVDISSLLAARKDLAIIEKTSNSSVRKNTQSEVNKVLIGKVPDRGGRTSEQAPPPPEMPSWQQRQAGPSRGGRGGGGQGRGDNRGDRGGYHRGGGGGARAGSSYDHRQKQQNYDAAGSYTTTYRQSSGSYNQQHNYGNQQFDNGNNQYQQRHEQDYYQNEPKRPKTYDSFQNQKTTYADQYVQESQYNQQYQPRQNRGYGGGGRDGGGRSNYHRGGRGGGGQNYY